MLLVLAIIAAVLTVVVAALVVFADGMSDAPSVQGISVIPTLVIGGTITAILFALWFFGGHISWVRAANAQYINGPPAPVTADKVCDEFRGLVGMSRKGLTLRALSCSGRGHRFHIDADIY